MKLYATVTSERASKGQGGNKYLDIVLLVGDAKNSELLAKIKLYIENGLYCLDYIHTLDSKPLMRVPIKQKGKKQKGEKYCDSGHIHFTENCKTCMDNIPF